MMRDLLRGALDRLLAFGRGHPRGVGTTISAVGAAVAARMVVRHRHAVRFRFPDPGESAAETALSVHNAAKATLIGLVREGDDVTTDELVRAARAAMEEGLGAGADVVAVAIGVVEGAARAAHLVTATQHEVVAAVAEAVVDAASGHGAVAGARVHELLEPHLPG